MGSGPQHHIPTGLLIAIAIAAGAIILAILVNQH